MQNRRTLLALAALTIVSMFAFGCGPKDEEDYSTAPPTNDSKFSTDQAGSSTDAASTSE